MSLDCSYLLQLCQFILEPDNLFLFLPELCLQAGHLLSHGCWYTGNTKYIKTPATILNVLCPIAELAEHVDIWCICGGANFRVAHVTMRTRGKWRTTRPSMWISRHIKVSGAFLTNTKENKVIKALVWKVTNWFLQVDYLSWSYLHVCLFFLSIWGI